MQAVAENQSKATLVESELIKWGDGGRRPSKF